MARLNRTLQILRFSADLEEFLADPKIPKSKSSSFKSSNIPPLLRAGITGRRYHWIADRPKVRRAGNADGISGLDQPKRYKLQNVVEECR